MMLFVTWFTSFNGISRTRETERMHSLPESLPMVAIWHTLSSPYLVLMYWMISPRRLSSKSMSTSGMSMRVGLMKRSKIRPCSIGSVAAMPRR